VINYKDKTILLISHLTQITMNNNFSISNTLIALSILATGVSFVNPEIFMYGMNTAFLER